MDISIRSILSKRVAAVVALAALTLCQSVAFGANTKSSKHEEKAPHKAQVKVAVRLCDQTCGNVFSLATTRDLTIYTEWRKISSGPHTQQVQLLLPNGSIFQKFETKFDTTQSSKKASWSGGALTLSNVLPVTGTAIQQRNLVGVWTVKVLLDDQPAIQRQFTFSQ